jgi:nucleotide-binding universal stress UspA family protein
VKILVAIDALSSQVPWLGTLAARPWPASSSFWLFSVFNPYPFTAAPTIQERLKRLMLQNLESAAKPLKMSGWDTTTRVIEGNARRDINRFAREWGADWVVVGCNEVPELGRLLLGSTAQSVVRHAPCSVEVIRPTRAAVNSAGCPGMRILVATDGSDLSVAALRSVASRPWPDGSVVRIISVPEFILLKDPSYIRTHEVKDLGEASVEDAKHCVARGAEMLAGSKLQVCSDVPTFQDRPHCVILNEAKAWQTDMIVVGSHGRSGFDRVIMGSVSEAVALHAKCSVEVIRQSETVRCEK